MSILKLYKHTILLLSITVFGVCIAQQSENSEIDIQSINSKSATPTYTNNTNLSENKVLFKYKDSKTQIIESKEYGHSQRNIKVNSSIGSYNLSKPLNGAITDDKSQRNPSIQLIKF